MELGQLGRNPNRGWQRSLHRLLQLGGLLEASRVLAVRSLPHGGDKLAARERGRGRLREQEVGETDHPVGDVDQKDQPGDEREHVGKGGHKREGVVGVSGVLFEEVVGSGEKTNDADRAEHDAKEDDDTRTLVRKGAR